MQIDGQDQKGSEIKRQQDQIRYRRYARTIAGRVSAAIDSDDVQGTREQRAAVEHLIQAAHVLGVSINPPEQDI